jgi:hypothetical protein
VQQPHLGLWRQFPNFVYKDGTFVGPLEAPPLLADGAGESALLVTEKLAVQKRLGKDMCRPSLKENAMERFKNLRRRTTMTIHAKFALAALLSLCAVGWVTQSAVAYDGALTFTIENDTFTGSDNNYTNGVGISWVSAGLDTYGNESLLSKWGPILVFPAVCLG